MMTRSVSSCPARLSTTESPDCSKRSAEAVQRNRPRQDLSDVARPRKNAPSTSPTCLPSVARMDPLNGKVFAGLPGRAKVQLCVGALATQLPSEEQERRAGQNLPHHRPP